jgi:hypothetical protein
MSIRATDRYRQQHVVAVPALSDFHLLICMHLLIVCNTCTSAALTILIILLHFPLPLWPVHPGGTVVIEEQLPWRPRSYQTGANPSNTTARTTQTLHMLSNTWKRVGLHDGWSQSSCMRTMNQQSHELWLYSSSHSCLLSTFRSAACVTLRMQWRAQRKGSPWIYKAILLSARLIIFQNFA